MRVCFQGVQPLLDGVIDYLPNPSEVDNFATDSTKSKVGDDGEEIPYKVRRTRLGFFGYWWILKIRSKLNKLFMMLYR